MTSTSFDSASDVKPIYNKLTDCYDNLIRQFVYNIAQSRQQDFTVQVSPGTVACEVLPELVTASLAGLHETIAMNFPMSRLSSDLLRERHSSPWRRRYTIKHVPA